MGMDSGAIWLKDGVGCWMNPPLAHLAHALFGRTGESGELGGATAV